ncbi:MAG: hypothetical protein AAF638_06435 [Pseudomonadota bacterium]
MTRHSRLSTATFCIALGFTAVATVLAGPGHTAQEPQQSIIADVASIATPIACEGEAWPYRTAGCVSAIRAANGLANAGAKTVRVVPLYEQTMVHAPLRIVALRTTFSVAESTTE